MDAHGADWIVAGQAGLHEEPHMANGSALKDDAAQKAGLVREEVIALRLYTGPMSALYHAALRSTKRNTARNVPGVLPTGTAIPTDTPTPPARSRRPARARARGALDPPQLLRES